MTATESEPRRRDDPAREPAKPLLVVFGSDRSGRCRRVDGFLAQVLQRRHNHETFRLRRVELERRPDLFRRFRVSALPTLLVMERAPRAVARLENPAGAAEIREFLSPWLR